MSKFKFTISTQDLQKLVDWNQKYEYKELKAAMTEDDRYLKYNTTLSVSPALKSYVKSKKQGSLRLFGRDNEIDVSVVAAEMILVLEELVSAIKPKCDEIIQKLVYRVFETTRHLDSSSPLREYVDYYSSVYVDVCLPVHLETLASLRVDERLVSMVNKLVENILEETSGLKVAQLSEEEFFEALREYRAPSADGPIGGVLYRTLIELAGDAAQQVLHAGDDKSIERILNNRLAEPCRRLSLRLFIPTSMIKTDLEMSPRPLEDLDARVLRLLGLGLSGQELWKTTHDKKDSLLDYIRSLSSPTVGVSNPEEDPAKLS